MPNEDSGVKTLLQGFQEITKEVITMRADLEYIRRSIEEMKDIPENIQNLNYIVKGANGTDGLARQIAMIRENLDCVKKKVSDLEDFKKRIYWIGGILVAVSGGVGGFIGKLFEILK